MTKPTLTRQMIGPEQWKVLPVEKCSNINACIYDPAGYRHEFRSAYSTPSNLQIAKKALECLYAAWAKDQEIHAKNLPAIENNQRIHDEVKAIMKAIGIPDRWKEKDLKSRARYTKYIEQAAGYLGDLARNVPVFDGFNERQYQGLKQRYAEFLSKAEQADKDAQLQREREAKAAIERQKSDIEKAAIILRYELDPAQLWDWTDILGVLRKKDQRIDLACAMQMTRGDWSEGYYRVSDALDRFKVETEEDGDIYRDVCSCFSDDIDGRVFRDTAWSYGRIFESVTDTQLAADAQNALGHWMP